MHTLLILPLLLHLAAAQLSTSVPTCAQPCLPSALLACNASDISCVCGSVSASFDGAAYIKCVQAACTSDEIVLVNAALNIDCPASSTSTTQSETDGGASVVTLSASSASDALSTGSTSSTTRPVLTGEFLTWTSSSTSSAAGSSSSAAGSSGAATAGALSSLSTLRTSTSASPPSSSTSSSAPSTPTSTPDDQPSSGLSAGAKAGIGIGAALGVVLLVALAFWYGRRSAASRRAAAQDPGQDAGHGDGKAGLSVEERRIAELGDGAEVSELKGSGVLGGVGVSDSAKRVSELEGGKGAVRYELG